MDSPLAGLDNYLRSWLYVGLITCMALAVYTFTIIKVGQARAKYGIMPPATTGNPDFERHLRVQYNTLENIIIFLPTLWIFAAVYSPKFASILGVIWVAGRVLYAKGYYEAAEKRMKGFLISMIVNAILLGGSILGLLYKIL